MATEYGVQTNNIFDLLNERPNAAAPKKKAQPAAAPAAKAKGTGPVAKTAPGPAKGTQQPRKTENGPRTGGPGVNASPNTERAPTHASGERGRGGKNFRDAKRYENKERRFEGERPQRGRMFERKSGTGRSPVENKKGGGGKANWGKPGQSDLEGLPEGAEQVEGKEPTQQDAKAEGGAPSDAPAEPVKDGEEAEEEEEDKTLTLEEFQAQQKKKLAKVKLPKTRKAGEGVEQDKQWAEAVPLTKKLDDEPETLVPLAPKKATKPKKKAKAKEPTSDASNLLSFTPAEPKRGGGGGRGRGEGRGGRGSRGGRGDSRGGRGGRGGSTSSRGGAPRKYSPEQSAPHFDERSFPTLGKAE